MPGCPVEAEGEERLAEGQMTRLACHRRSLLISDLSRVYQPLIIVLSIVCWSNIWSSMFVRIIIVQYPGRRFLVLTIRL